MKRPGTLIGAAVVALAACSSGGGDEPTASRTAGTSEPSTDSGALPPELARRQLVFSRADGTYVARADGSQMRKLLDLEDVFEFQADVSPDGTRVLLRVDDEGAKQGRGSSASTGAGRRKSPARGNL